ncbi:MAG: hypothetical protein RLZZ419_44 [Pseudomonadota bacterium]
MYKFLIPVIALIATSALAGEIDKRKVLTITELQRLHVIEEMAALLSETQNILAALSKSDMAAVHQYASSLGIGMSHKAEDHLKGILPKEFMQLGISVHQDFDAIAADALSIKDPKHTLQQLGDSMSKCVACHANYQIRTVKASVKSASKSNHHDH